VYRFPGPLPVNFKDCNEPNAFYSKPEHAITMCHQFFDFFTKVFTKTGTPAQEIPTLVNNAMLFFFLHELGHAMVGELELPITGKGEDAADEIATILLIAAKEPGVKAALAGAFAFEAMSSAGLKSTFWDTHSFNDQRKAEILCLLYGANPKAFAAGMKAAGATAERMRKCPITYRDRHKAWNTHLTPHLRKKAKR
jgi:hypothetical protein